MLIRLRDAWRAVALLTFNILLLVLLANFAAWTILASLPPPRQGPRLDPDALLDSYPGYGTEEIQELQSETWGRPYVYEPFTQFKEGPVAGRFVNVDESGFRRGAESTVWPPDPEARNVFVFGGSTTFGYGVADDETIPASLERRLRRVEGCAQIRVYNLARSNYYSTQERILFEQLLTQGHVPTAAVFIDGLNEFGYPTDEPKFTRRLSYLMAEKPVQLILRAVKRIPLALLARRARDTFGERTQRDVERSAALTDEQARAIVERWRANRRLVRAVADEYSVATAFVVQPVPSFDLDPAKHPFPAPGRTLAPEARQPHRGYELLSEQHRESLGDHLVWLADAHRLAKPPHYVDRVHYTVRFSAILAGEIAEVLQPVLCKP